MADGFPGSPTNRSMGLGLRVPGSPVAGDPATRMGLGGLQGTRADALVGLGGYVPGQYAMESAERIKAPDTWTAPAYFNQATNEMFAGDRAFAATDVRSALETAQAPTTTAPQGEGWVPLPESSYRNYLSSLSERRGVGELLGLGARQVGEGVIGGAGALAEMAGSTRVGPALRGFAEEMFGQTEDEQLRSALIAQNSTLMERIIDGAWQAVPTVVSSLTGAGLAGLGVRAAGGGALAIQAGATAGGTAVNFPIHVNSFYEAAVRNGFDPNDPEVKTEILGGAITNTALDMFGINAVAGKVLSRAARQAAEEAGKQAARGALRNALTGGIRTGFSEAVTEASQTFLESVLFDPTVRGSLTASDWTALGPYIAQTYGDDILVAAGAGAILGGGVGAAGNFRATGQLPTDVPTDLNAAATKQAAEKEAPAAPTPTQGLGPTVSSLSPEEAALAANWEANALLGPAVPALGESEQALASQWQAALGPMQLTPEMRVRPPAAAATPGGRLLLTPAMRVRPIEEVVTEAPANPLLLTPEMRQRQAEAARGRPGQALLTQRQRVGEAPTVPMMAPVVGVRPGAMLLRPDQRVSAAVPEVEVAPAAPAAAPAAAQPVAPRPIEQVVRQAPMAAAPAVEPVVTPTTARRGKKKLSVREQAAQSERDMAEFLKRGQEQQMERLTAYPQAREFPEIRNFLSGYLISGSADLRSGLGDTIADYTDWLGARTDEEWAKIGTAFRKSDNPYLSAAALQDPAQTQERIAKFEALIAPPTTPTTPTGKARVQRQAAEKPAAPKAAAVQRGPAAQPKPRAEAVPEFSEEEIAAEMWGLMVFEDSSSFGEELRQEAIASLQRRAAQGRAQADSQGPLPPTDDAPADQEPIFGEEWMEAARKQLPQDKSTGPLILDPFKNSPDPGSAGLSFMFGKSRPATPEGVTVESVTRSPKKADVPYQMVTLSDGRKVRMRNTGTNFAQVWTFMKTGDVIGEGIKAEVAATRVAELASQGALPEGVVDTETEVAAAPELTAEEKAAARAVAQGYVPLDQEIDDFIEVLDTSTDKAERGAAISGLQDLLRFETNLTPESRQRVTDYLAGLETEVAATDLSDKTAVDTATAQLTLMIDEFNAAPGEITGTWQTQFRRLVAEVRKTDPNARYGDRSLLSYAKVNGDPNFARVDGVRQIVGAPGNFMLADWNTIDGVVDLNGKPVTAIAPGRIDLLVRNYVSKLARAPKVTVARNQADLRTKNPRLYARAVAARPQGDFDTALAMGYSFGDGEVIIFSDRIATEQQLNFVLAHESMGHYGLRAIMPDPKFDALMEAIYAGSPAVKTAVDAAVETNPRLSRAEAVEEYLSDYAAVLETSIVARVWNAIKGLLDKLGIQTGDSMVRYLLDQSRRYVRYGTGVTFDAQTVGQRLHAVESMGDTGRFSVGPKMRDVNLMAGLLPDQIGGYPMNFEEGWQYLKRQGVNSAESWDKFKATFLSLANFRSRQNPGLLALEKLLDEARNLSMSIKVDYNEKLALVLNRAIAGEVGGISDAQTAKINEMLYAAQRFNVAEVRKMGDLGNVPLFRMENGRLVPNQPEVERLQKLGTRTLQQMRDGFEYEVTFEEAGKTVTKTERFAGVKGLTEQSIEWRGYQKIRAAMDDIELRLLRARYEGALQERDLAFRQIAATVPDGELTADERAALTELAQTYGNLYTSNVQQDETGRAVLDADYQVYANDILRTANSALIGKAGDRFDALRKLLTEPRQFTKGETDTVRRELPAAMAEQAADDLIARLQGFKSRMRVEEDRFVVQNKIKQVILAELANKDADKFTKRTIATGYTPILREGAYQIRVEATVDGRVVRLQDSYREQLVYSQFGTAAEAMEMADKTNGLFGDNEFEAMVYDPDAGGYRLRKVKLRAVSESALDAVAAPPQLNLNEFIRGLRQFDINLSPEKMEDVIVALTKQNSAARNRLERVFTPGAQMDGVMATMRHIESRASTISKTIVRPRLGELMDRSMSSTMALWNGDADHLAKLKQRADDAAKDATLSREAKVDAQREYEQYAYMYNQTNPEGRPRRANQFYNEAARTVAFLDGNQNVDESDFGSGPMVSRIRAATSMMQLGGSVATGALNVLSVYTNGIPYLSSYNPKTAFGGGFSVGKVVSELHRAAAQVGGPGITSGQMNTAEFYEQVSNSPELQKRYKLKAHEARFIAQEILDGAMIPAQSNALVGTARGRTTQGWQQKFLDGWMWTFNVTEQASRRTFGLTAYRLEFARRRAAGLSEEQAATAAREFAVQALQFTMGEYSVLNRPPAWRSGIQSFMYMYKVFPTTSVQMFMNMSRGGKVGMLVGLWLLTGLTGLPFAEDLEDVIDTLAQKLKVSGWQGARYEAAQFIDGIFPGMSPLFLKGVVNNVLPADVAGRTSLGDLLPATDILLAGADVSRGISEIAGPAPAMLLGTAQFATDLLSVPFSTTTTLETAAREAPVTMVRALADAYAYLQTGAVVDRRGYTVSPDMDAATVITRALGFYPAAAANQYEMIRSAKRMTDYQREVVTGYRTAWVSAMMRGDREFAKQIEESVADWNAASKGTALEIRNFVPNSRRALEEARRPATARTLRSAPNAAEQDLQRMVDLLTLN